MSLFCIYNLFLSNDDKNRKRELTPNSKITLVFKSTVFNSFPEIVISSGAYKQKRVLVLSSDLGLLHSLLW